MRKKLWALFIVAALPTARAATPFDGKWTVSFGQWSVSAGEVTLIEGKGSWIIFAPNKAAITNPCFNRHLPAVVKSASDAEVMIDIDGNSVLAGCLTETLILHPGANGTWTGVLGSGMAMTWARE